MSRSTALPIRLAATTAATGLLTLGGLALAGPASAHVTVTPSDTAAGSYTVLTFSNGHGCDGSPTTAVVISIPEGINAATPTRNPFYDVSKQTVKLDPPVTDAHGNELTERVDTVTYTAKTPLPDGYRDAFEVSVQLPEDAAGQTLNFPTIQRCQQGQTAWTEVPADGQDAEELEHPAPSLVVTDAVEGEGHDSGASDEHAETSGADPVSTTTSTEAVSSEEPAEASNGWGMAGVGVGALGLVVGGVALARSRTTA